MNLTSIQGSQSPQNSVSYKLINTEDAPTSKHMHVRYLAHDAPHIPAQLRRL
jgi:hypothetical protein